MEMDYEGQQHDISFSSAWLEGSLNEEQIQGLTPEQLQK
jgi:hypothetical protein